MSAAEGVALIVHPSLTTVFQAFEQAGARWCVLRGEAALGTLNGDVDLLIHRADTKLIEHLLNSLGFAQLPAWGHGSHAFFFSYYSPTNEWIKLDFVTELAFGPCFALRTRAASGCLNRRQRADGLAILAPDDAFWTLLMHCLLDRGNIPAHHATRLMELAANADIDGPLAQVVGRACPAGWDAERLVTCARCGDWTTLERLAPALLATWTRRQRGVAWWRTGVNKAWRWLDKWRIHTRRGGLSVALLGPDGAGKTTLAASLRDAFYFPTRTIYMGRGGEDASRARGRVLPGMHLGGQLLKNWRRYLFARYHQARGRLVIFDRYTYDTLLVPREHLHWQEWLYFRILGYACPPPNVILVLDAPGHTMYARKGEHSPDLLEAQRQGFLALQRQLPQLEIVDATRPEEVVRASTIERIWQHHLARQRRTWR